MRLRNALIVIVLALAAIALVVYIAPNVSFH